MKTLPPSTRIYVMKSRNSESNQIVQFASLSPKSKTDIYGNFIPSNATLFDEDGSKFLDDCPYCESGENASGGRCSTCEGMAVAYLVGKASHV